MSLVIRDQETVLGLDVGKYKWLSTTIWQRWLGASFTVQHVRKLPNQTQITTKIPCGPIVLGVDVKRRKL